jgi:hypothetical protein
MAEVQRPTVFQTQSNKTQQNIKQTGSQYGPAEDKYRCLSNSKQSHLKQSQDKCRLTSRLTLRLQVRVRLFRIWIEKAIPGCWSKMGQIQEGEKVDRAELAVPGRRTANLGTHGDVGLD